MTPWQTEFLERIAPMARGAQQRYGVPASVCLAQAVLESSWGRSLLAQQALNLFGMKWVKGRHKGYCVFPTVEVVKGRRAKVRSRFARFSSLQESVDDWAWLVTRMPRYRDRTAGVTDPIEFARRLQLAGYATDPQYAAKLARLIRAHSLTQYDQGG